MSAAKNNQPLHIHTERSEADDNIIKKAEIERMKKLISEKIKDPKLAKKAAQIISEMLNSK